MKTASRHGAPVPVVLPGPGLLSTEPSMGVAGSGSVPVSLPCALPHPQGHCLDRRLTSKLAAIGALRLRAAVLG